MALLDFDAVALWCVDSEQDGAALADFDRQFAGLRLAVDLRPQRLQRAVEAIGLKRDGDPQIVVA